MGTAPVSPIPVNLPLSAMKKTVNAAGAALVGLTALMLSIAAAPLAASLGLVAFAAIAGVVWMTAVHAALGGRREMRRVPVPADAPRAGASRSRRRGRGATS